MSRKEIADFLNDLKDVAQKASSVVPVDFGNVLRPRLDNYELVALEAMLSQIIQCAEMIRKDLR